MEAEQNINYKALKPDHQEKILQQFLPQEQQEIKYRQQILSSLAYFIGKDFQIPVELNNPGEGWHWDFKENKIRIDPKDLMEKPMDYLRFVISHEGGHRRISRTDDIPQEVWKQPGFSFMMNAIEDPRTNNFVAEAYPRFADHMNIAYQADLKLEEEIKAKAKEKLGHTPRFMKAGFEYIKQWFAETKGIKSTIISEDLPKEIKEVVKNTLDSARDSWLHYPSKQEADESEPLIKRYANISYEINRDKIWPEFKKLVDADMEDQKLQEFMKGENVPQEIKDKIPQNGQNNNVDLDSLPEDLKQKIKDSIDSLPEDIKKQLQEKAQKSLSDFENEVNEEIKGKLNEKDSSNLRENDKNSKTENNKSDYMPETEDQIKFKELIKESLEKDENVYEEYRREVLPLIDILETDLREIFVARREQKWLSGFKTGKRIDIKKRMQEKAKGVSAVESKAWQKRELPQEKDYAISLLVDLSGTMRDEKIKETFKGTIILAEVLNRLSINTEILGFNDKLYTYQEFGQNMNNEIRENMGNMLREVYNPSARYNDDGWAVQQASERLAHQKAVEKFLFVLSDGLPEESSIHKGFEYELSKIISDINKNTNQKLIGLGIGRNTKHVERYYPNSIADIEVSQMPQKLTDLIREVIANYDTF